MSHGTTPGEAQRRRQERAEQRTPEQWRSYARELCYRQLSRAERSTQQLRDALQRNLVPDDIIEETLRAFQDADLVDDARFAEMYVRSQFAGTTTSRRKLRYQLRNKGITEADADAALAQIDEDAERQAAVDFAVHKVQSSHGVPLQTLRRRVYGALARRGFSGDQIHHAMRVACDDAS